MKQSYWFKRANTENKNPDRNSASHGRQTANNIQTLIPDDTLRNQLKISAEKLIAMCDSFEKMKKFNETFHNNLINEEKSIVEVRCIEHNSAIILYCHNDHRLVCSNCVFASDNHKRHQITEAAKSVGFIDADIKEAEKILRVKVGDLLKEKNSWGKLIEDIDKQHSDVLASIQQQHESASATLASIYCKNKNKLEQIFHSTKESIHLIMKSYTNLTKFMSYSHSIPSIRHLYLQEVLERKVQLERLMPSTKIGQQILYILNRFGVNVIKAFKSATNQLFL